MNFLDVVTEPWAMSNSKFSQMINIYNGVLKGEKLDFKAIFANGIESKKDTYEMIGDTAIIKVMGPLSPGVSLFSALMGGTFMTNVKKNTLAALENGAERIIYHINSPGGTVEGAFELADFIEEISKETETIAYSDGMIASAAMLIASATRKRYISGKTNQIGSIGVITSKFDYSEENKKLGLEVTEFVSGKYKNVGSADLKLTDFERGAIQEKVDYLFSIFADDIARRLGLDVETVVDMQAKIFIGEQAIQAGLVDGVATLEDLLSTEIIEQKPQSEENMAVTLESLQSENKELLEQIQNQAKEHAVVAERQRIQGIQQAAFPGMESLMQELIENGTSVGEAALAFNKKQKESQSKALVELKENSPESVAVSEESAQIEEPKSEEKQEPKTLEEEYAASAELQHEFQNVETYVAYVKAEQGGHVKILTGK